MPMKLYKLKYTYAYTHKVDIEIEAKDDFEAGALVGMELSGHAIVENVRLYHIGEQVGIIQQPTLNPNPHA